MSQETEVIKTPRRWSAQRKKEVVMRLFCGEKISDLSRELGLSMGKLEEWKEQALVGIEVGFKSFKDHPIQEELDDAKKKIGELTMANELLWKRVKKKEPFHKGRLRK